MSEGEQWQLAIIAVVGVVVTVLCLIAALSKGHSDNHKTQRERIEACKTIEEPANRALCLQP